MTSIARIFMVGKLSAETYTNIHKAIRSALDDVEIDSIILVCNSGGGDVVSELYELSDLIFQAQKPILAFVDGQCASCAYWLVSQSDLIVATRGSFIGGIGLYGVLEDSSNKLAGEGVVLHRVATSPFKGADAPGVAVGEEAKQALAEELQAIEEIFHSDIQRGRPSLDISKVSDGKLHIASRSVELGLIDSVANWDSFIEANFATV